MGSAGVDDRLQDQPIGGNEASGNYRIHTSSAKEPVTGAAVLMSIPNP